MMKIKKLFTYNTIETKAILKKAIQANRASAKLNGTAKIIPNQNILINALVLQEAKVFVHNELFERLRVGVQNS